MARILLPSRATTVAERVDDVLIQKLVIHAVEQLCSSQNIQPTSALALIGVDLCVYAAATLLFLLIERPFLQLRKRLAPRK